MLSNYQISGTVGDLPEYHALGGGGRLSREIIQWLEANARRLSDNVHLAFRYNVAIIHFMMEDFVPATRYIHQIQSHAGKDVRKEIRDFAGLLNVVFALAAGDAAYAETLLQNAYQYFLRNAYPEFFRLTVEHLRKLIRAIDTTEREQLLAVFVQALAALKCEEPGKPPFGLMELMIWAEASSRGIGLRQAFQEIHARP